MTWLSPLVVEVNMNPPTAPGLGTTAADLASAPAGSGFGTSTLSARLTLVIPPLTMAGHYLSSLTLSAVTAFP